MTFKMELNPTELNIVMAALKATTPDDNKCSGSYQLLCRISHEAKQEPLEASVLAARTIACQAYFGVEEFHRIDRRS